MTDWQFICECRARTGETPQMIGKLLDRIYHQIDYRLFVLDDVLKEIVWLLDNRMCESTEEALRMVLPTENRKRK